MSDNLRDRIIKAIGAGVYGDIGNSDLSLATRAADAVIEALEAGYVLVPKNVTLVQWADEAFRNQPEGKFKHERTTDWETDE